MFVILGQFSTVKQTSKTGRLWFQGKQSMYIFMQFIELIRVKYIQ